MVLTKIVNCNNAYKSCHLKFFNTKANAALTQFCDFLDVLIVKDLVRSLCINGYWSFLMFLKVSSKFPIYAFNSGRLLAISWNAVVRGFSCATLDLLSC